jgi:hypothetical protein
VPRRQRGSCSSDVVADWRWLPVTASSSAWSISTGLVAAQHSHADIVAAQPLAQRCQQIVFEANPVGVAESQFAGRVSVAVGQAYRAITPAYMGASRRAQALRGAARIAAAGLAVERQAQMAGKAAARFGERQQAIGDDLHPAFAGEIVALDTAFDDQHLVFPDLGALGFEQFVEHRDFKRRGAVVDLDEGHLAARREFAAHADHQAGKQLRFLPGFERRQRPANEARHFGLHAWKG